ncbi:MAG: DUF1080 domain-containing protein [Puniceicoccaceae bacterium]|nr:MAG: DUF1080 domain-containing protein [Puniceicoccaceae bacterium]
MKTDLMRNLRRTIGILGLLPLAAMAGQGEAYSIFNPHPDDTKTPDGAWALHDMERPWPERAKPKAPDALRDLAEAPADAIILFDGKDLSAWQVPELWVVEDGIIQIRPGQLNLSSKQDFGSIRLHLEWQTPADSRRTAQDRGNSGVFLMSTYEVQILDSYDNPTYADGMAAALYGHKPPAFDALRPPGEWQYYDIWFRRPTFDTDGAMKTPATVTVLVNGILVHDNEPFPGPASHRKRRPYRAHADALPLTLQYLQRSMKLVSYSRASRLLGNVRRISAV